MQFCSDSKRGYSPVSVETVPTPVNKTGLWRFLTPVRKEKVSPCRAACPLENGIPHWMKKVKEGNWQDAWQIMSQYNPFPAITGSACYRFCMEKCSRGSLDEAIDIGGIEKEIGLWRQNNFKPGNAAFTPSREQKAGETRKRVAIVGSGPAGLSCAYYLNMLGIDVTVFEKLPVAGGLLATGIPEYRLSRSILEKELEILQAEGIVFKKNMEIKTGRDLQELQDNFDAVLLAVGAQESRPFKIKGSHLPGVTGALEFLRDLHLQKLSEIRGRVIVAGGGNAALDAACAARRHGAEAVTLLYRRSPEEMPAHPGEIEAAREAGVNFVFQAVVEEIIGRGRVEKLRVVQAAPSRRGEALKILPGSDLHLDCSLLLVAAGQESSLTKLVPSFSGNLDGGGDFTAVGGERVFGAGDAVAGPSNVANAIFGGRKAALALFDLLKTGQESGPEIGRIWHVASPLGKNEKVVALDSLNFFHHSRQGRLPSPQKEAGRCLSCGTCNECGVCWVFCPDLAIESHTGHYEILLDYCKGCGICVLECPAGALEMEEVGSSGE
jgi:formate dehydrogenase (NADP+) beta subunit